MDEHSGDRVAFTQDVVTSLFCRPTSLKKLQTCTKKTKRIKKSEQKGSNFDNVLLEQGHSTQYGNIML